MVMIRCPSCGQRTLDVASKCPKCGHVLLQNPLETNSYSDLVSCRRCQKHIDRKMAVCPYCGHNVKRARTLITTAWVLVALIVAGGVVWGAYQGGYLERFLPDQAVEIATAPDSNPPAPDSTPPTASPIVVPPPDPAAKTETAPAPAPVQPQPEPAESPAAPRSLQTRWTSDWANVREAPSMTAPVVRVLAPGKQVDVTDIRGGWWSYYEDGAFQGYIANSVLGSQPPTLGTGSSTARPSTLLNR